MHSLVAVDLAVARSKLGGVILRLGEPDRAQPLIDLALAALERQHRVTPKAFNTCSALGLAYEQRAKLCLYDGQSDDALDWLDKGSDLLTSLQAAMPNNQHVRLIISSNHACRADAFERQGDFEQSIRSRQLALAAAPDDDQRHIRKSELAETLAK